MAINLTWVSYVIDLQSSRGQMAGELHMSQTTMEEFVQTLQLSGVKPPAVRWRGEVRIEQPWRFRNIPLVANQKIPDGGMLIRPQHRMDDPEWLDKTLEEARQAGVIVSNKAPENGVSGPAGEVYSSAAISHANETVSDVLMTAMTGCDDVESVIVISTRRAQVEVRASLDRFGVIGLLQAALAKVAHGE